MIRWTESNNKILEALYNRQENDAYIARALNTTLTAVAKQRSNKGLVSFKKNVKTQAPRVKEPVKDETTFVLNYIDKEGFNHIIPSTNPDVEHIKSVGRNLMIAKGIKMMLLLKPILRLKVQNIIEEQL